MSKLVEDYYKPVRIADAKLLSRGQFCWAPIHYLPNSISTLELVHYDPKNEQRNRYAVLPNPPQDIVFNHTPVHELRLEHDEELTIVKAKLRKSVIVSQAPVDWALGVDRLSEKGYVCLPLYSFKRTDTTEFRNRVKALEYPWWIYLPENNTLKISEGFARLDRLQVVEANLIQPIPVSLTDDSLFFISEWLRYYLTGEIDPIFVEDREQSLEELNPTS